MSHMDRRPCSEPCGFVSADRLLYNSSALFIAAVCSRRRRRLWCLHQLSASPSCHHSQDTYSSRSVWSHSVLLYSATIISYHLISYDHII